MFDYKNWKAEIAWLKEYFPIGKVRVWRVPYTVSQGSALKRDNDFLIKVAKRLDFDTAVFALYEEWAHCLTYDTHPDHSDSWARAHGRILRKSKNEV